MSMIICSLSSHFYTMKISWCIFLSFFLFPPPSYGSRWFLRGQGRLHALFRLLQRGFEWHHKPVHVCQGYRQYVAVFLFICSTCWLIHLLRRLVPQMKLNFSHHWKIWFYLYLSSTRTRIQTVKRSKDRHMYCAILYLYLFHKRYLKT